jgi:hypothetical protein
MKRLVVWNFLLAVCATAGIYELRRQWIETQAQEQAVLLRKPAAAKVEVPNPPARPTPFQATSYADVSQKDLFAKDRNPNVEIPVPPPPPPPPPMPALPKVYGVLGLPSGPVAIMSDKPGAAQKKVRVGENIGDFKIAKLDSQHITLLWNDKTVEKSIDELLDRTAVPAAAAEAPRAAAPAAPTTVAPAGPPVPPQFGIEIGAPGNSVRACKSDDTSPAGTVLEGYRKSIENTPFGQACRWLQTK